jgi:hypothetical protein
LTTDDTHIGSHRQHRLSDQISANTDEEPYTADATALAQYLEDSVLPQLAKHAGYLENRHLIREQVLGEAVEFTKLESLSRYEVHLDRKLERMLTMLLRLQSLRPSKEPD